MEEYISQGTEGRSVVHFPNPPSPGWLYFTPSLRPTGEGLHRRWKRGPYEQLIETELICLTIYTTVMKGWGRELINNENLCYFQRSAP